MRTDPYISATWQGPTCRPTFTAAHQRLKGRDLIYVCGSDEFGVAIVMRAIKDGVRPRDIVDRYHPLNQDSFAAFGMSFDHYGRTTSKTHEETSQDIFRGLARRGHFTLKTDKQLYDPGGRRLSCRPVRARDVPAVRLRGGLRRPVANSAVPRSVRWRSSMRASTLTDAVPVLRPTTHWYLALGDWQPKLETYVKAHADWKPNVLGQIGSLVCGWAARPRHHAGRALGRACAGGRSTRGRRGCGRQGDLRMV